MAILKNATWAPVLTGAPRDFWERSFFSTRKLGISNTLNSQRIRVAPTRVRIADICLVSRDAPVEQVAVIPPLLCVEVLSPEDRLPRAARVMEDYARMGVPNLWLIDPLDRIAYIYTGEGRLQITQGPLTIPATPIHLDLTRLFANLDE